jgi:RNA polymerase sigma-70 factor (ECF subfamily)
MGSMHFTDMGAGGFPSTHASVFEEVGRPDGDARRAAMERLLGRYWNPVYAVFRRGWRQSPEDAQDLTQDFLASVVEDPEMVERFEPERGRFRAYLKTCINNFMRDVLKSRGRMKRGGDARTVPLDTGLAVADRHAPAPDEIFDDAWRSEILARALDRLERRLTATGRRTVFDVFHRYELDPAASYGKVGEELGLTAFTVKNHLTRAREEFRRAVTDVVGEYAPQGEALRSELDALFG